MSGFVLRALTSEDCELARLWRNDELSLVGLRTPYQLTREAGTAIDLAVGRGLFTPPDAETGAALFDTTQEVLEAAGFEAYEVSNHAKGAAARSRHNLIYWQGQDYVGAGPGAHGRITLKGARHATYAARKPADYISRVVEAGFGLVERETLSPREAAQERLLSGLRITEGVAREEVAALDLPADRIAGLVALGLLADDPERLRATPAGRLVLDRLTVELVS